MSEKFKGTALVQQRKGSWEFGNINSETKTILWHKLGYNKEEEAELSSIVKEQRAQFSNIILLPSQESQTININDDIVVLVSKNTKILLCKIYPNLSDLIWEVDESINNKGLIDFELTEPEINKALRFVFSRKPDMVILCLANSIFNPTHEKNLQNVLRVAGYKATSGLSIQ